MKASLVELDNRLVEDLTVTEKKGASSMRLSIPRWELFGKTPGNAVGDFVFGYLMCRMNCYLSLIRL